MVSVSSFAAIIFVLCACFIVPISIIIYFIVRKKRVMRPLIIGALVFVVSQIILRIPLISTVLPLVPGYNMLMENVWFNSIFLGVTASLFEEFGRLIACKTILRTKTRWIDGFAFGFGHGAIEAMLMVGMVYLNNLAYAISINNGTFGELATSIPIETREYVLAVMTQTPPHMFWISGIERLFTMIIHTALGIMVFQSVKNKKISLFVWALAIHALLDSPLAILQSVFNLPALAVEAYIGIVALALLFYIIKSKKTWVKEEPVQKIEFKAET